MVNNDLDRLSRNLNPAGVSSSTRAIRRPKSGANGRRSIRNGRFEAPGLGAVEAWNEASHDAATGIVTYQTHYRIVESGRRYSASSDIRFTDRKPFTAMLDGAGLKVDKWLGDWNGAACGPASPEFIPVG